LLGMGLDPELERCPAHRARDAGRSKSSNAPRAIWECAEDRQGYHKFVAASLEAGPCGSLEKVFREIGFENKRRKNGAKTARKAQRGSAAENHALPAATGRRVS
jgi:hypothetical protein